MCFLSVSGGKEIIYLMSFGSWNKFWQEIRVSTVTCDRSSICDITTRKTTTNRTSGVETKLPEQKRGKHLKRHKQDDGRIKNHSRRNVKWFEVGASDSSGSGWMAHINFCRMDPVLSWGDTRRKYQVRDRDFISMKPRLFKMVAHKITCLTDIRPSGCRWKVVRCVCVRLKMITWRHHDDQRKYLVPKVCRVERSGQWKHLLITTKAKITL